jgi:hypothetical protein
MCRGNHAIRVIVTKKSACLSIVFLLMTAGCSDWEYRMRPDNSGEVPVIKNIDRVFPLIASDIDISATAIIKDKAELINAGIDGGFKRDVDRLFEELDQINGQVRTFVVSNYTAFISSQLETDKAARENGRLRWDAMNRELQQQAFEVRKISQQLKSAQKQAPVETSKSIVSTAVKDLSAVNLTLFASMQNLTTPSPESFSAWNTESNRMRGYKHVRTEPFDGSANTRAASGSAGDTLEACAARIPKDASDGQRMLAEESCRRDQAARR